AQTPLSEGPLCAGSARRHCREQRMEDSFRVPISCGIGVGPLGIKCGPKAALGSRRCRDSDRVLRYRFVRAVWLGTVYAGLCNGPGRDGMGSARRSIAAME